MSQPYAPTAVALSENPEILLRNRNPYVGNFVPRGSQLRKHIGAAAHRPKNIS